MKKIISMVLALVMLFVSITVLSSCELVQNLSSNGVSSDRVILETEIIDGCLWITYVDDPGRRINVGHISTEETQSQETTSVEAPLDSIPEETTKDIPVGEWVPVN